jgi:protocatechuate 3,4-dioxygenase, alpha subunit
VNLRATSSQTVGPYFSIGWSGLYCDELAGPLVAGQHITIHGRVLDGDGQGVPDAVIETWQADAHGKYARSEGAPGTAGAGFTGFGRIPTDGVGCFRFSTIKPGPVPGPNGTTQAPHILVSVFMRGLLNRLVTRIYFPGDPANEKDFVLNLVEPARRATLIAKPAIPGERGFEWNVILQGEGETVFFDC